MPKTTQRVSPDAADADVAELLSGADPALRIGARLKHARIMQGLRLRQVAERAGCSESMISKIENDRITPSIKTFHRVCDALGLTMGEVMSQPSGSTRKVWRAGERPVTELDSQRQGEGIRLERLVPYAPGFLLQGNIHVIAPGGGSDGTISHKGEEVGYVLAGTIELFVGEETFLLGPGDSFLYKSEEPHGYRNSGPEEARVIFVNTPPSY